VTVPAVTRRRSFTAPSSRGPDQPPTLTVALTALAAQVRPPDRVIPVPVAGPSPAGAIAQAMRQSGAAPPDGGFIWLLDESTRPSPEALDRLLACAALDPGAAVLGPVGITVDRAGRRRPAPGDALAVRDVLAVERAGALVRVDAWRLLDGPDPLAGRADDLDLCLRAWRAGLRVVAVPSAHIDLQPHIDPLARADPVERADALRVRLAQSGALGVPAAVAGVVLAAVGRAAAALAGRRGHAAATELLVLAGVLADPVRLWRLAGPRGQPRRVPARALRGLLPRPGHPPATVVRPTDGGLERTRETTQQRRATQQRQWESAAKPTAGDGLAASGGADLDPDRTDQMNHADRANLRPELLLALLGTAAGWALTGMGRSARLGGPLPPGASDLWSAVWSGWVGPAGGLPGGPGPAPSWTALLGALSSALGGRPELAARVLLIAAPALAALAAYRAARVLRTLTPWARAGLAACYALAPPVTAAAIVGDLARVGACVMAPLVLSGAARMLAAPTAVRPRGPVAGAPGTDGGWAPVWALSGALLVAVACSPRLLMIVAVGLVAGALAARSHPATATAGGDVRRRPRRAARVAVVVATGCVPLLPALWVAARGGGTGLLSVLADEPTPRTADVYPLAAFALGCVLAALVGGRPARPAVAVCWLAAVAGWVTSQDGLTAAALVGAVGAAWSVYLRPPTTLTTPARGARETGRVGLVEGAGGAGGAGGVGGVGGVVGNRPAAVRAAVLSATIVLAPALLFARAAGAFGTPPAPDGWSSSAPAGPGRAASAASSGTGRILVLRPSAGGVTYALAGGHGPTVIDAAGGLGRPEAEFLGAVVADLTVGGAWGVSALPAFGADAVFVPKAGDTAAGMVGDVAGDRAGDAAGRAPTDDAWGPAGATGGLVGVLDSAAGLERDQPRPDGYYWHLGPAAGPVGEVRLLPPGLAAAARSGHAGAVDQPAVASAAAARAAAVDRVAVGPSAVLASAAGTVAVADRPGTAGPDTSAVTSADVTAGTSSDVTLPAGSGGRLLVLAEPADPGWRATLAGRRLTPGTAWGWAQAFEVPAASAGQVRVRFDHTPHRTLVVVEAVVVAAVGLGGLSSLAGRAWRRRRGDATVWWAGR